MKLIRIFIIIPLLLLGIGEAFAQNPQIISGTVSEMFGRNREPLPGVNISIVNTQNRALTGTTTNTNGQYYLRIPEGEGELTIVYSYIGMKSQRIKYTGQATEDVVLQSDVQNLDLDIVVTASISRNDMGLTQKELVSATQKVDMEELVASSPVVSIEEALQGQLGGVDIVLGGGDPGAKSSIRIRGTGTLNASADPLIVIDGVPYPTDISDDFDFGTADEEDLGALLNISPFDIETIEVLKDASATAIWGTKGANGVLVITTKKGRVGKTSFTFSSKFTTKVEPRTIPMLNGNEYTALMQDALWNSANYVGVSNASTYLRLLFDTPEIGYDTSWKYFNEFNQNTDWLDEIRQTATKWENNFSMNGGGEKATYRFSLGHLTDGGTTIGTQLRRINASAVINYQFSDRLKFGADFSYSETNQDANYLNGVSGARKVREEAFSKMPNKSPYTIDPATGLPTSEYFTYQTSDWEGVFNGVRNYNPVAMANEATNNTIQRQRLMTLRADYKILDGFTTSNYVSINMTSKKNTQFLPQSATGVPWVSFLANQGTDNYSESLTIQTENKLTYIKNWNRKHNLIANAVLRTSQSTSSAYYSTTSGMASSDMSDPVVGTSVSAIGSGESEVRSVSFVSLLNYTLLDRYVFQGSMAIEGNSIMGREKRIGYFPGAGFSWNAHQEPFMEELVEKGLNQAKLRLGVGQSGRAPTGSFSYQGAYIGDGSYMTMSSIYPTRMQLDNLKWETSTEYNIGADFAAFNNRLKFTFDYYWKYSTDLLQKDVTIPSTTGYSSIKYFNSGKMTNQGWEFRADAVFFKNKDWNISGYVNFSRNKNTITEMPDNMVEEYGAASSDADMTNGKYAFRVVEGQPIGSFYGYRYKGVYSDKAATYARDKQGNIMNDVNGNPIIMKNGSYTVYPGDAMYEDVNNDGVINQYDLVYLGNSNPTVTGGAGLTVKYKQVSMRASFYGRFGQSIVNQTRMNNESMYGISNQSTAVLRRWRNEGDVTDIPRALYNEGLNYLGSDRFVEDASYVRLQSLTLSYAFPRKICNRLGITSLSVFGTGYNLFTWTNYTGQDPEVSIPSVPNKLAADEATTPISKQFTIGLNLNF